MTSIFDFNFLNPFYKNINGYMLGIRYGYAQFIIISCFIIYIILLIINSKIIGPITIIEVIIILFIQYFGLSCILIPYKHKRYFILPGYFK